MSTILIVEDDKLLNEGLAYALRSDGYTVLQADNAKQSIALLNSKPDLIILDINLPDTSGIDVCKYIRGHMSIPVIFLTAIDTEQSILLGFKAGGDDYITKPFSLPVLKERIKAVLKRGNQSNNRVYSYQNLTFDFDKRCLTLSSEEIPLTATECKLITLFIENRGKVLTRAQLLERVWDIDGDFVDENALSVNIRRLRAKIGDTASKPVFIKTIFGIGYMWGDDR